MAPATILVTRGIVLLQIQRGVWHNGLRWERAERELFWWLSSSIQLTVHCFQALENCSYEYKREQLILLQIKLRNKTGVDPLRGTGFEHNPVYCINKKPAKELTLLRGPPTPPYRKGKVQNSGVNGSPKTSTFTSHIAVGRQNWENFDESENRENRGAVRKKSDPMPTFKSHLLEHKVPGASNSTNLIDF